MCIVRGDGEACLDDIPLNWSAAVPDWPHRRCDGRGE